jgi:hypothetical protein
MKIPSWLRILLRSAPVVIVASAVRLLLVANDDPVVATKIASSGGVTGTLVGTLIPLLPPFLPLAVVGLVLVRRWLLAALMAGAMTLVSPAEIGWSKGWQKAVNWLYRAMDWSNRLLPPFPWRSSIMEHNWGHFWSLLLHYRWPLWISGIALLAAIASAPSRLRWTKKDELYKKVEQQVREEEDTGKRFAEGRRDELRKKARKKRGINQIWRFFYGVLFGLLAVPAIGLVMLFYAVPITGVDAGPLARSMWLPDEMIEVNDQAIHGVDHLVGYVLSSSDGWFVILTERDRAIVYVKADRVLSRQVCSVGIENERRSGKPLVQLNGEISQGGIPCSGGS